MSSEVSVEKTILPHVKILIMPDGRHSAPFTMMFIKSMYEYILVAASKGIFLVCALHLSYYLPRCLENQNIITETLLQHFR